ncbi:RNA polymerase sigma factor [Polyangium sorediatum]|uniref:RNA polymerase sigma factor n=1 Tax=Polyangium sorediatum TaxID=889274 RepID=A0ABT6NPA7_9BACT|nr:RNA polymerase sigma factor [Polyangium sorediatum]MDI1430166.1 RNA polymerase sigma factor [Polyangium sorediatum]
MNGRKTKEVDDLPGYLPWMVERARKFVPDADAEDVAIQALRDAYDVTRTRPPAEEVDRVKAWLFRLVHLRAKAHWKQQKRRALETLWDNPDDVDAVAAPIHDVVDVAEREWFRLGLEGLSPERRELVLSCCVEGVTVRELSSEQGVNENTLSSWLQRAREELRMRLQDLLDDSKRRLGMLLPFGCFGLGSADEEMPAREGWDRGILRACARVLEPAIRFAVSVAVGALVVGFSPSGPGAGGVEPGASEREARAEWHDTVVVSRSARSGGAAPSTTLPPANAPPKLHVVEEGNFSLLVHAKAALNRGDARRALVLLDEYESKMTDSTHVKQRRTLRAAAMSMLAETR